MTGVDEEIPQAALLGGGAATSIVSTSKNLTRIIQAPPNRIFGTCTSRIRFGGYDYIYRAGGKAKKLEKNLMQDTAHSPDTNCPTNYEFTVSSSHLYSLRRMNRSIHHQNVTGKTRDPNEAGVDGKNKNQCPAAAHIMIMAEKRMKKIMSHSYFPHGHFDRNDPHQAACRGSSAAAARHL